MIVAAGGPEPYTRRSPSSITVRVPALIRRRNSDSSHRAGRAVTPRPEPGGERPVHPASLRPTA